jgi:hypothetical protein
LLVCPSETSSRSNNFSKLQASNGIIEHVNPRPIDISVILVISSSNQIKVSSHEDWRGCSRDHFLQLLEEQGRGTVISRTINPHKLEEKSGGF